MKIICVIGKSYSGKSTFIEHVKNFSKCTVVSYGDHFRSKGMTSPTSIDLQNLLMNSLLTCNTDTIILDNPFKDINQARMFFKTVWLASLSEINIEVAIVNDIRTKVNFYERGRPDDWAVNKKRNKWEQDEHLLMSYLNNHKFLKENLMHITYVYNTDKGFIM